MFDLQFVYKYNQSQMQLNLKVELSFLGSSKFLLNPSVSKRFINLIEPRSNQAAAYISPEKSSLAEDVCFIEERMNKQTMTERVFN